MPNWLIITGFDAVGLIEQFEDKIESLTLAQESQFHLKVAQESLNSAIHLE